MLRLLPQALGPGRELRALLAAQKRLHKVVWDEWKCPSAHILEGFE